MKVWSKSVNSLLFISKTNQETEKYTNGIDNVIIFSVIIPSIFKTFNTGWKQWRTSMAPSPCRKQRWYL